MADIIRFDDAAQTFERDKAVWRMRLGFVPIRQIAEQLDCTVGEVEASWIRMLGAVPPDMRARITREELERLDQMERAYWIEAMPAPGRKGSIRAAELCLKIKERRAKMLGLDAPPQTEPALVSSKVKTSSTERITAALDRIAGKIDTTIDGEVLQQDGEEVQQPTEADATGGGE